MNLSASEVLVDAAIYNNQRVYIAYRSPALPGQTQPTCSILAVLTLSEGLPRPTLSLQLDTRIVSLSVDCADILVNTGQTVNRLTPDNQLIPHSTDCQALEDGEIIRSVAGTSGELYLLTYKPDTGYRIRTVTESGDESVVMLPVTADRQVIASLEVSGDWLHLLMIDSGFVIWQKYRIESLASALDDVRESQAILPENMTPAAITLITEKDVNSSTAIDQVFILGQDSYGQPQYSRLLTEDLTSTELTSSPVSRSGAKGMTGSSHWLLLLGAGATAIGAVTLRDQSFH